MSNTLQDVTKRKLESCKSRNLEFKIFVKLLISREMLGKAVMTNLVAQSNKYTLLMSNH